jgi:large subunit ribosomal protein L31
MKSEIHPEYFPKAKVQCACGNSFTVGATKKDIKVEICAKCHPFFTGEEKLLDVAGRVERFKTRKAKISDKPKKKAEVKKRK